MNYINCIVMDESRAHILLLIKQKGPAFLLGKDNFPGGKLEEGEIPSSAAIREVLDTLHTFVATVPLAELKQCI